VRALYDAFRVPREPSPYDVVQLRVAYPSAATVDDPQQGVIGPDRSRGPLPVVVLSGNFNCGAEHYHWLVRRLAGSGCAVVTYAWVAPLFGGRPGLSTGVDLDAVARGERPTPLLDPLLAKLGELGRAADLDGALDLDRVLLGGHSAGGSLALLASSGGWWPAVRGAFSYGGHTRAQVPQGLGADTYLPLPGTTPLLLMGGTHDGVVDAVAAAQLGREPAGVAAARRRCRPLHVRRGIRRHDRPRLPRDAGTGRCRRGARGARRGRRGLHGVRVHGRRRRGRPAHRSGDRSTSTSHGLKISGASKKQT
jgi:dienelactone hydrolase